MAKRRAEHRDSGWTRPPRTAEAARLRVATERSLLELSGECGFRQTSVAGVLARSGSNRARFYATWASKEECFGSAYAAVAEPLAVRILGAGGEATDWGSGLAAALGELGCFTSREPHLAAGLFAEVHVAGGPAAARREEIVVRLSRALDSGRGGSPPPAPPSRGARFIVEAVEATTIRQLARERPLEGALPDLLFIAEACYRGLPEARRAARRLAASTDRVGS